MNWCEQRLRKLELVLVGFFLASTICCMLALSVSEVVSRGVTLTPEVWMPLIEKSGPTPTPTFRPTLTPPWPEEQAQIP